MHFFMLSNLLFFVQFCSAKIKLTEGDSETMKLKGTEIVVRIQNPHNKIGAFLICLGPALQNFSDKCPTEYFQIHGTVDTFEKTFVFEINQQGISNNTKAKTIGDLRFSDNNVFSAFILELHPEMFLTFENVTKDDDGAGKLKAALIIIGVVFLVLALLVVILITIIYLRRNRATHTRVSTAITETDEHSTITEPVVPLMPTTSATPLLQNLPSQQPSITHVIKKTTSMTKPCDEKEKIELVPETKNLSIVVPIVSQKSNVAIDNANATKAVSVKTAKSAKRKTVKSNKKRHASQSTPVSTPPTTPILKQSSPLLPVDSTQSGSPSTEPTPEFGTDPVTNNLAQNSVCKARVYVPRNEAPIPGSTRRRRSAPIVDEVVGYRLFTETSLCFGQREKLLSGHNHMLLANRIDVTKQHDVSDGERVLLKANPEDAPRLADIVLKEAEDAIIQHCFDHTKVTMDELSEFWEFVNNVKTPASVGIVVLLKLVPEIFEVQEKSLYDQRVRKMPLCVLYTLMLNNKLPHDFRVGLATELRRRALMVIPKLQQGTLRETCFPTPYLTRIFYKNDRSFIEGIEIHSKTSKTSCSKSKQN